MRRAVVLQSLISIGFYRISDGAAKGSFESEAVDSGTYDREFAKKGRELRQRKHVGSVALGA